jgi:hypothetical protein
LNGTGPDVSVTAGTIDAALDPESFTFDLQAGQRVSVVARPGQAGATLSIEVVGVAGPVAATSPGGDADLSGVLIPTDGTYELRVTGDVETDFTLDVYRNALVETNDTADTHELSLDTGAVVVDSGRRWYAVVGKSDPIVTVDEYSLDLRELVGSTLSIYLKGIGTADMTDARVDLIGADGTTVLATSVVPSGGEYDQVILDVTVPRRGVYKVRMSGRTTGDYVLDVDSVGLEVTPPAVTSVTVSGPTEVNEKSGAQYTSTAHYADGSSEDVTVFGSWSENSAYAGVNSVGWLTTASVTADQPCRVTATYESVSTDYDITIKDVPDTMPPTPNPSTWAVAPYAIDAASIRMTATTATDPENNGVEYFFHNMTVAGHDSGWQTGATYTDMGLTENTTYTYEVQTRDQADTPNTGGWSSPQSAKTLGPEAGIFWRNGVSGTANIWYMNGGSIDGLVWLPPVPDMNWQIQAAGDFNGDDETDLLWRNMANGTANIWYLTGGAISGLVWLPPVPDMNWQIQAAADFNGDGKADLLWRNMADGTANIWYLTGGGVTGLVWMAPVPDMNWQVQAAADFNGDGKADLLWRNLADGSANIWYLNGGGVAGLVWMAPVPDMNWQIQAAADFNSDGKADLLWRNMADGTANTWYLNGGGVAGMVWLPPVPDMTWRIQATGESYTYSASGALGKLGSSPVIATEKVGRSGTSTMASEVLTDVQSLPADSTDVSQTALGAAVPQGSTIARPGQNPAPTVSTTWGDVLVDPLALSNLAAL